MLVDIDLSSLKAFDLQVDSLRTCPVVTINTMPELSWRLSGEGISLRQKAFQIQAASSVEELLSDPDLWDSGKIYSEQNLYIPWGGKPLSARQKVFWRVRVWNQNDLAGAYSEISTFSIGLLKNSDWLGHWISFTGNNSSVPSPSPYFRKEFSVAKKLKEARLYISSRGLFEASLNGQKISNDEFVPGWTDYDKQLQYMTYDITEQLQKGTNALGVILADGWYCGYLFNRRKRNLYGDRPELLLQLELDYLDGSSEVVVSDSSWKCKTGPILYSDIYDGEMYDAGLEMPGWDKINFNEEAWQNVHKGEKASDTKAQLIAKLCPPVRNVEELKVVEILNPKDDVYIWDFGQNIAGKVRISVKGFEGCMYTCQFAEMVYPDGTLYNLNYRNARSTDYFVCAEKGNKMQVWEPRFTFHGFRYVQIDGFQNAGINVEEIEVKAIVLHSDLEETATFSCGHELLDKLCQNIRWGQKGNFLEIPTDCPQRDERLGWTGDAHVFASAASVNMNILAFFNKWLKDLQDAQREDGAVSCIAPDVIKEHYAAAVWADAMIACPWILYQRFADKQILRENYTAMKKWLDYQLNTANDYIRPETAYGDWLAFDSVTTPSELIGTVMMAYGCQIIADCARLLQISGDSEKYSSLKEKIKSAFQKKFVDSDENLSVKSQTACILALYFNMLTDSQREKTADLLVKLIAENGQKLSTGFVGTAWILQALSEIGRNDLAYEVLLQEECPSWLYSVKQGATTIWERWDSFTLEKGFGNVGMNSFNHYAYGAVFEWIVAKVAGLTYDVQEPGGKLLHFNVFPDKRLSWMKFALQTPYGKAVSNWEYKENNFIWQIRVPINCNAKIKIPEIMKQKCLFAENDSDPVVLENAVAGQELELQSGNYKLIIEKV